MLWDMNFVLNVLIYRLLVKAQVKLMKEFLNVRNALVMNMRFILMGNATIVIALIVLDAIFRKVLQNQFVIVVIMIII
jgi:hypothetical protein